MSKQNKNATREEGNKVAENTQPVTTEQPGEQPKPLTMSEINQRMANLSADEQAKLKALQVPANTIAGTVGHYRSADGKGTTTDRKLAKLSITGKPIPVYTPTRSAVQGVSATHADETLQLRGRYAQGWGQQVVAACKARAEKLGRKLTAKERDTVLKSLGNGVPKAWQPRYNKDGVTPASQYARHVEVMREFGIETSN